MTNKFPSFNYLLMVKHLSADFRENIITNFSEKIKKVWKAIPKEQLRNSNHGISSLSTYVRELEGHIYDQKFLLLNNLNDYKHKIYSMIQNLKYNGDNLLIKYSPEELSELDHFKLSENYRNIDNNVSVSCDNVINVDNEGNDKPCPNEKVEKIKKGKLKPKLHTKSEYAPIGEAFDKEAKKIASSTNTSRDDIISAELEHLEQTILPEIIGADIPSLTPCFKCPEGTRVTFRTMQSKSADEPETVYYKCTGCKSQWKN